MQAGRSRVIFRGASREAPWDHIFKGARREAVRHPESISMGLSREAPWDHIQGCKQGGSRIMIKGASREALGSYLEVEAGRQ